MTDHTSVAEYAKTITTRPCTGSHGNREVVNSTGAFAWQNCMLSHVASTSGHPNHDAMYKLTYIDTEIGGCTLESFITLSKSDTLPSGSIPEGKYTLLLLW